MRSSWWLLTETERVHQTAALFLWKKEESLQQVGADVTSETVGQGIQPKIYKVQSLEVLPSQGPDYYHQNVIIATVFLHLNRFMSSVHI